MGMVTSFRDTHTSARARIPDCYDRVIVYFGDYAAYRLTRHADGRATFDC